MANQAVAELKKKSDAAWGNLSRQLEGMEPHIDRPAAPGEWTTREVLCHLLFEPGFEPRAFLETFAHRDLPVVDIKPGDTHLTPERRNATLGELAASLDAQRRSIMAYLDELSDADLGRKARIPIFKDFMGTDEVPMPMFIGAMFDYHWNDHAGQIARIRKTAGLAEAK
jgi:hypothetical protein